MLWEWALLWGSRAPRLAQVVARESTSSSIPGPPSQSPAGAPSSRCSVGLSRETSFCCQALARTARPVLTGCPSSLSSSWIFFFFPLPWTRDVPYAQLLPNSWLYALNVSPLKEQLRMAASQMHKLYRPDVKTSAVPPAAQNANPSPSWDCHPPAWRHLPVDAQQTQVLNPTLLSSSALAPHFFCWPYRALGHQR